MTAIDLPYAHLNLRRNPFGWLDEHERGELACVDISEVIERLIEPDGSSRDGSSRTYAVQFIGEKGFGKTTHLLAIRAAVPGAIYSYLAERGDPFSTDGAPVLVDEAQRLTRRQKRELFALPVALVLGTHVDMRRALVRTGRRVATIEVGTTMSPERLQAVLQRRLESSRRGPGPIPFVTTTTAERMLATHGPDVRAVLDDLYDDLESMTGVAHI